MYLLQVLQCTITGIKPLQMAQYSGWPTLIMFRVQVHYREFTLLKIHNWWTVKQSDRVTESQQTRLRSSSSWSSFIVHLPECVECGMCGMPGTCGMYQVVDLGMVLCHAAQKGPCPPKGEGACGMPGMYQVDSRPDIASSCPRRSLPSKGEGAYGMHGMRRMYQVDSWYCVILPNRVLAL